MLWCVYKWDTLCGMRVVWARILLLDLEELVLDGMV